MPVPPAVPYIEEPPAVPTTLDGTLDPPAPFQSWCDWAQDGWRNAMNALSGTSSGVKSYHIGSRGLEYRDASQQLAIANQWAKLVEFYCGTLPLPSALTGLDTACRIIPRDV